jgi:effector-binding domain-containing protein
VEPEVIQRSAQPYMSITNSVRMGQLGEQLPPQIGEIFGWLAARRAAPAGPPFWKYNVIDMAGEMEVEVGVPTVDEVLGDERVRPHVLPAGRYAVAHHIGHPDSLEEATRELLEWGEAHGIAWDIARSDEGDRWAARVEEYLSSPEDEPDMEKWQTNLIFKVAD